MKLNQFPDEARFFDLTRRANVIPICVEVLADTMTPVTLLEAFYRKNDPLFLLESVEGGEHWGRYSFLGISARHRVRVFADHIAFEKDGRDRRVAHHGDPLAVLKTFMDRFRPADMPELPRFWGGLVGYFTYEMVSFFEAIPNRFPPGTPLADFCVPDRLLIFDNIRHTLLVVSIVFFDEGPPDRKTAEQAYRNGIDQIDRIRRQIVSAPAGSDTGNRSDTALSPRIPAGEFRSRVARVKEYIQSGDIIQAVISQPFVCDHAPDACRLYRAQRYINPSPYMFFVHLDPTTLVGSSPETMIRLENNVATLRPIAGTRPRGDTEQADRALADELLADEKERAEHLMLVDLGRNDLGRVARTGTVQVTDLMVVERYSHVMHLVSNIYCDLDTDADAWDLLRAVFPAGTLSGAPKIRAMEIIADIEQRPRGPYGGAVGYISFHGNMDLAITIRTARIENDRLTVQAGGGIVADSDPESERIESVNKAKAIEKALRLAAGKPI